MNFSLGRDAHRPGQGNSSGCTSQSLDPLDPSDPSESESGIPMEKLEMLMGTS